MTLSFLCAACASSTPPSASSGDFSQVAQAERQLDIAHARAEDPQTPCLERGRAGARAQRAAERVCEIGREHADADLLRRCQDARRVAMQASALAERGCAEPGSSP